MFLTEKMMMMMITDMLISVIGTSDLVSTGLWQMHKKEMDILFPVSYRLLY